MAKNKQRHNNKIAKKRFFADYLYKEELAVQRAVSISLSVAVLLVIVVCGFLFINDYAARVEHNTETEAQTIMGDISVEVSGNVVLSVDSWFAQLEMATGLLSDISSDSDYSDEISYSLSSISKRLSFDKVGLILQNGDLYYIDDSGEGVYYNIAAESVARSVTLERNRYVGRIYITGIGEQIIFGIPYDGISSEETQDDAAPERISGIAGIIDPLILSRILHTSTFSGSAYLALIQSDGARIVDTYFKTENESPLTNMFNIVESAFSDEDFSKFVDEITEGKSGIVSGTTDGEMSLYYYAKPDEETWPDDWRILIVVQRSYIMQNVAQILDDTMSVTYIMFGVIALIVLGIVVAFCMYLAKNNQLKYVDPVTNGINETRFKIDAKVLINRYPESQYALVNISIVRPGFNSEIGRNRSDLLKTAYEAIGVSLHEREIYARMLSDRFSLLITCDENTEKRVDELLKYIQRHLSENLMFNIQTFAGVYVIPKGENDVVGIIDKAKVARRESDVDHQIVYFNNQMLMRMQQETELESKQHTALVENQFCVYYQLKRDIQKNTWGGAEALVRWIDPEKGMISPGAFIPLFEKNGFVTKVDIYVFECVCRDLKNMLDKGIEPLPVSINISRRHLAIEGFLNEYAQIIKKYDIPSKYIELELTESMMIDNSHSILDLVKDIHAIGCTCSIDDFGSGYSSLSMLKEYDFDIIKLDRSFFGGKGGFDSKTKQVVSLLIKLCHKLGKKVVSEGIETQEQVDFLVSVGCDYVQGFYFARPCPLDLNIKIMSEDQD